jgi:hypothetical protein
MDDAELEELIDAFNDSITNRAEECAVPDPECSYISPQRTPLDTPSGKTSTLSFLYNAATLGGLGRLRSHRRRSWCGIRNT